MDLEYPRFYYETIAKTGIDPVIYGAFGSVGAEGCEESGSESVAERRTRPAQLAEKALAKASGGSARVPRKRAPRKATAAKADGSGPAVSVPKQAPSKAARGTAKVASSE